MLFLLFLKAFFGGASVIHLGVLSFFSTKNVEWNDLQIYVNGAACANQEGLECGVETKKDELYSAGPDSIGIQSGNKSRKGTLTVLMQDVNVIWDAAVLAGGDDPTDVVLDIVGSFQAQGSRRLRRLICTGCEISAVRFKMAQGDTSMKVDLPFTYRMLASI